MLPRSRWLANLGLQPTAGSEMLKAAAVEAGR
jgi:hypothetical protein